MCSGFFILVFLKINTPQLDFDARFWLKAVELYQHKSASRTKIHF